MPKRVIHIPDTRPPVSCENSAWLCAAAADRALERAETAMADAWLEITRADWMERVEGEKARVYGSLQRSVEELWYALTELRTLFPKTKEVA